VPPDSTGRKHRNDDPDPPIRHDDTRSCTGDENPNYVFVRVGRLMRIGEL